MVVVITSSFKILIQQLKSTILTPFYFLAITIRIVQFQLPLIDININHHKYETHVHLWLIMMSILQFAIYH